MLLDLSSFDISGDILIDNYTSHGIMMFDGNNLWFIAGLHSGTDGKVHCIRQIVSILLIRTIFTVFICYVVSSRNCCLDLKS